MDRAGITLSALCAVHCLATLALVSALGIGGQFLANPLIHEVGLAVAMVVAAVAIGLGALRHRRAAPFVTEMTGLSFMGGALVDGVMEADDAVFFDLHTVPEGPGDAPGLVGALVSAA